MQESKDVCFLYVILDTAVLHSTAVDKEDHGAESTMVMMNTLLEALTAATLQIDLRRFWSPSMAERRLKPLDQETANSEECGEGLPPK